MSNLSALTGDEWGVWRSFSSMRRQLDRALETQLRRDSAVSVAEYEVLLALHEAPDRQLRIKEISARTGWEKSRVSHQVTRLEKRRLLSRSECETDGRGSWVALTSDGRRTVLDAMRAHGDAIRQYFFDLLAAGEGELLQRFSEQVLEAIGALPDTKSPTDTKSPAGAGSPA